MPGREAALEERIARMREILEKDPDDATLWFTLGRTLLELAFCWLLMHDEVPSVIAGASNPEQLLANVDAVGWRLTDVEIAEVDDILR